MDQKTLDNLTAQRVVHYLVTPINQWDAYRLGIIDSSGKPLREPKPNETQFFNFFHVLCLRLKDLLKTSGKGANWVLPSSAGEFYLGQKGAPATNFTNWSVSNRFALPLYNPVFSAFKESLYMNDDSSLVSLFEDGGGGNTSGGVMNYNTAEIGCNTQGKTKTKMVGELRRRVLKRMGIDAK